MRIYLANVPTRPSLFYDNKEIKYILMTFLEANKVDLSRINKSEMLLDSGAFTYLNSQKNAKLDWAGYIERYAEFIVKNKINNFFELDIDPIVGYEEVKNMRARLELLTRKKCIPVWHKSRGLEDWIEICKKYDYVSIGGIVTKEIKKSQTDIFIHLLKIANQYKCKVHGLGFTTTPKLHKYKFYSVDSTNWRTSRFNMYYLFDPVRGVMQSQKKTNRQGMNS